MGNTCHTGHQSCFFTNISNSEASTFEILFTLEQIINQRQSQNPENSYTAKLFTEGLDRIAQKVGEEAVEVIIAAKNDESAPFINETADLIYHLTVLMKAKDCSWPEVLTELKRRMNISKNR